MLLLLSLLATSTTQAQSATDDAAINVTAVNDIPTLSGFASRCANFLTGMMMD